MHGLVGQQWKSVHQRKEVTIFRIGGQMPCGYFHEDFSGRTRSLWSRLHSEKPTSCLKIPALGVNGFKNSCWELKRGRREHWETVGSQVSSHFSLHISLSFCAWHTYLYNLQARLANMPKSWSSSQLNLATQTSVVKSHMSISNPLGVQYSVFSVLWNQTDRCLFSLDGSRKQLTCC